MKAILATVISLALTTVVIGNAYYQKKQFYPSIVYLTNSNPSMAVSLLIFYYFNNNLILCFWPWYSEEYHVPNMIPFSFWFCSMVFAPVRISLTRSFEHHFQSILYDVAQERIWRLIQISRTLVYVATSKCIFNFLHFHGNVSRHQCIRMLWPTLSILNHSLYQQHYSLGTFVIQIYRRAGKLFFKN